jgi:hypothetical protein
MRAAVFEELNYSSRNKTRLPESLSLFSGHAEDKASELRVTYRIIADHLMKQLLEKVGYLCRAGCY